jgi:hypothetical protein
VLLSCCTYRTTAAVIQTGLFVVFVGLGHNLVIIVFFLDAPVCATVAL